VLPFRYVAAARAAPEFEEELDVAMIAAIGESPILQGRTIVLVDVSGSMAMKLSKKSEISRMDAAAALAALVNGEHVSVYSFSDRVVRVPHRYGMAGIDAVLRSQPSGGTRLVEAIIEVVQHEHDRLIVISDEQAHLPLFGQTIPHVARAFMLNVASFQHGVGYGGGWVHLDGWSDGVIRYIHALENERVSCLT
jgi:hypothetical protein